MNSILLFSFQTMVQSFINIFEKNVNHPSLHNYTEIPINQSQKNKS